MRDQLHLMELVDNYLDGAMNPTDRTAFEDRLRNSEELRALVEDQQRLRRAARRSPARAAAKKAYKNYRWGKSLPGMGVGAVVLIAAAATMFLLKSPLADGGSENTPVSSSEYRTLADTTGTHLEPLVLTIDPEKDTTLVTPNGIVLDIPQGAFVDSLGAAITTPVRVTLLEALDPLDIMRAGLSTMSGDTLLETGGMFYFDAQANGKAVKIDPAKPLTAMVPAMDRQDGMQLYQGVKQSDGTIDWQNPQPLKKSLVPVDITTLNFYPPGYEAKLAELGLDVTNKAFKDSLYYSFSAALKDCEEGKRAEWRMSEAWPWSDSTVNAPFGNERLSSEFSQAAFLFASNCAACHKPDRDMTGPALVGARDRWHGRGDIHAWVKNSVAVIKSGNEYANALFKQWNKSVMTPNALSDMEIDAILQYVEMSVWPAYRFCGIDPAGVKTIWSERFNGTSLATKEFEERMLSIHRTCDSKLLDLYATSFGRDLSYLDSMAVGMGHGDFASFALRNEGRVQLPAQAADRLRTFYENNSRAEAEAIRKTQEKFWNEQWKKDVKSDAKRADHAMAESVREGALFQKELAANLDTVYKQLGYTRVAMPTAAWVVPVTNTGWWNVDKAVLQATTTRSSMSYTDDKTGKTATLTYTPLIVEVADRASYDEVVVYLIPSQLNSYQRMKEGSGGFTERLNSIFTYDLFCLGMKGKEQFAFKTSVSGEAEIKAVLSPVDEATLRSMIGSNSALQQELIGQAEHLEWLVGDKNRRKSNADRQALKAALLPVVFPCVSENMPAGEGEFDHAPRFPGGPEALYQYVQERWAGLGEFDRDINERFIVLKDGSVDEVHVEDGPTIEVVRSVEHLILGMPPWEAAIWSGKQWMRR